MYPVTSLFQQKIQETTRTFKASIQVQHSAGVLTLTDEDIILGTMSIVEDSQTTSDFGVGAAVSTTFEVEIKSKRDAITGSYLVDTILIPVDDMLRPVDWYDEYSDISFEGATVIPQISLLVGDDVWESVPLGRFTVDEVFKGRTKIKIKALDYMVELDKPYALSALSYPATLYQIYTNICNVADVQIGTPNFINQDYLVNERPQGDYTLRDMLSFVAAASGSFARFNRLGALELCWYASSGIVLTGANRFDFQAREDVVGISGVSYTTVDDVTYVTGTDEYVVDLTDNPLVQGDLDTLLPNIYDGVKDTKFTPFESRWQGNPAAQPGDSITQIDRDGNIIDTIVTYSAYKYRGASSLAGRGLPVKAKRYSGSTNKKIAEIKRKVEKEVGDKLTSLEQAQLNVTELIANMLGGYVVTTDDAIYIADNPDIEQATKVWKWGLGGFGYSSTGVNGPYTTGVSADGTIVAMLVAANIVTADMIETGILTSKAGNMALDLDNNIMRIADNLGNNRVLLGEYELGKFGLQIKDSVNNRTLLDDKGLLNSWQENMTDNFDSNHPAKLKFYIPPNAGDIVTLNLSFSLQKFRSNTRALGSGGSQSIGTSILETWGRATGSAGGHTHSVSYSEYMGYSVSSVSDHSHSMDIDHSHTVNTYHNHLIKYGVYEDTAPTDVGIKINGVDRTVALGGLRSGEIDISDLNIKPYINTNGWHTIEFFMPPITEGDPKVGRVTANVFGMLFMYAPS